jgi:hypothetical protein
VRRDGPNKVCEERHEVFGPHGMLYMTGTLGTFKDGIMSSRLLLLS